MVTSMENSGALVTVSGAMSCPITLDCKGANFNGYTNAVLFFNPLNDL